MTREELIRKSEAILKYTLSMAQQHKSKNWAYRGMAQLDMLDLLLDDGYEHYEIWLSKFSKCL